MNQEQSDQMLTAEVAREAEATPATVRLWEKQGKLRASRTVSGVRLFNRADVEAFIQSRKANRG